MIFGVFVVLARTLRRAGGILLVLGAGLFLIALGINGPFWSEENPQPPLLPSLIFIAALVLIGVGWVVLGVPKQGWEPLRNADPRHRVDKGVVSRSV
jgi:hypothetical protein